MLGKWLCAFVQEMYYHNICLWRRRSRYLQSGNLCWLEGGYQRKNKDGRYTQNRRDIHGQAAPS